MSDASCRLLTVFFDALAEDGIAPQTLVEGTDLDLAVLQDPRAWIPWADLIAVSARVSELVGGDDVLQDKAARLLVDSSGNATFLAIGRAFTSPRFLYRMLCGWISKQLFAVLHFSFSDLGPRQIRVFVEYDEGVERLPQLAAMVGATLVCLPRSIGLPDAQIQTVETPGRLQFDVTLPRSRSVWASMSRAVHAVWAGEAMVEELELQASRLAERNRELLAARQRAEAASALKSDFLLMVHHELRTPVAGMLGSMELLKACTPADERDLVDAHRDSARRLLDLLDTILVFNRFCAGDVVLDEAQVDVLKLVEDVVGSHAALGLQHQVQIVSQAQDGHWGVWADGRHLGAALDALVHNALLSAPGGVVIIQIHDLGDDCRIRVSDSGPGMEPEWMARACEPLTQGDSGRARDRAGMGMGLPLAVQIAEAHGGSLELGTSAVGGLSVTLTLPGRTSPTSTDRAAVVSWGPEPTDPRALDLLQAHGLASAGAGAIRHERAWPTVPPAGTGAEPVPEHDVLPRALQVLIVEDQPIDAMILERMVTAQGHACRVATDGAAGVEAYVQGVPDIVLMDCQMPGMDGLEATRRIRELERVQGKGRVPIVAVTAHALDEDRSQALAAGMDAYLVKPVSPATLQDALRQVPMDRLGRMSS